MNTITTADAHNVKQGDIITMPIGLEWWERLWLWLKCPWRWPPTTREGRFVVTNIAGAVSFEIEPGSDHG